MYWRQRIQQLYRSRIHDNCQVVPRFSTPVQPRQILECERQLNVSLAPELDALLRETNGVDELMDIDGALTVIGQLLWPIDDIIQENKVYRSKYQGTLANNPFEQVVIFANAGVDGILFSSPVGVDQRMHSEVQAWYPIDEEHIYLAPSLDRFLEGWVTGSIRI